MTETFKGQLGRLLKIEGGYSDHANDPGGKTQWGITEALAREYKYKGLMKDLPLVTAASIYYHHFWLFLKCEELSKFFPELGWELFDIGVNGGRERAGEFLQEAVNSFNRNGKDWGDIDVDGAPGPATLGAVAAMRKVRGVLGMKVLARAVEDKMGAHYQYLSRINPTRFEDFTFGWYAQRIVGD